MNKNPFAFLLMEADHRTLGAEDHLLPRTATQVEQAIMKEEGHALASALTELRDRRIFSACMTTPYDGDDGVSRPLSVFYKKEDGDILGSIRRLIPHYLVGKRFGRTGNVAEDPSFIRYKPGLIEALRPLALSGTDPSAYSAYELSMLMYLSTLAEHLDASFKDVQDGHPSCVFFASDSPRSISAIKRIFPQGQIAFHEALSGTFPLVSIGLSWAREEPEKAAEDFQKAGADFVARAPGELVELIQTRARFAPSPSVLTVTP